MSKRFSASNAARFIACPGSANLELALPGWVDPPKNDNGAKGVGKFLHELMASIVTLPLAQLRGLAEAVEFVTELRTKRRFKVLSEETEVAEWLPSKPSTTADLVLYVQDEIHILDFKTGKIPVEVKSDQMLFYARTYLHHAPKATAVNLYIIQPWGGIIDHAVITISELAAWAAEAIVIDVAITAGAIELNPSEHCTFCPANPHSRGDKGNIMCPAQMAILYPPTFNEDEILNL